MYSNMNCTNPKNKMIVLLFFILILPFTSCEKNAQENDSYTEPTFDLSLKSKDHYFIENVENETDYSNIILYPEFQEYTEDAEEISFILVNNNIAKGFYFCPTPFIDKKQNNKWVRIEYNDPSINYENKWYYCAIKNNISVPNSTIITILSEFLDGGFSEGEYKVTVFVGDKKVFTTFKVKK